MRTVIRIVFAMAAIILLVTLTGCHKDVIFNIGNRFDEPVTVYFEGRKTGRIKPLQSKIFYMTEVWRRKDPDLLLELKGDSGRVLYSRNFTWDELKSVLESVEGNPYWIGNSN